MSLSKTSSEIGVLFHVCDAAAANEAVASLRNIQVPVRIYLSVDNEVEQIAVTSVIHAHGLEDRTVVRIVPKIARETGPFVFGFREEVFKHEICLRIHTDRSKHANSELAALWQHHLFDELVGGSQRIDYVLEQFATHETLGVLRATPWLCPHR